MRVKFVGRWVVRVALGLAVVVSVAAVLYALGRPEKESSLVTPEEFVILSSRDAWLGVHLSDVTPEKMAELKLKEEYGAVVTEVEEDSPAAKAGLRANDVILEYQGERVESAAALARLVRETPAGRTVRLVVCRNGRTQTLTAKVERRELVRSEIRIPPIRIPEVRIEPFLWRPRLGISADALTPQLAEYFGVKQGKGVLVTEVTPSSVAQKAGLKAGDVIVRVDEETTESVADLRRAIGKKKAGETLTLSIIRDRAETTVRVQLEEARRTPGETAEGLFDDPEEFRREYRESLREVEREMRELQRHLREELGEKHRQLQKDLIRMRRELPFRTTI